jgi:hypothetical protein
MNRIKLTTCIYIVLFIFIPAFYILAENNYPDGFADQLIEEMDNKLFPDNFIAQFRMTNYKDKKVEQVFDMVIYNKNGIGSLTVFLSPASEKGKKMLLLSNTIWLYVPGTSRALPLSARQSFMGSSFSNSDLMDSTLSDDYDSAMMNDELIDDVECYKMNLTAKNNTVTYKSIIIWIRKDYKVPVKIEYYTLSGKLYKQMKLSNLKKVAESIRPTFLSMENVMESDAYTEVEILGIKEDNTLSNSIFTKEYLTK